MWQELKDILFTCDKCGATTIVRDVNGYDNPKDWGYEHPDLIGTYSYGDNRSKDICAECVKKSKT